MNGMMRTVLAQAGDGGGISMTPEQHLVLSYVVALGLLFGYAMWLWMATRRNAKKRSDQG